MLKVGLIGKIASLQPYVQQIRKEGGFEIIGKSSVGISGQPDGNLLSVPEYVKSVLIDAADAIVITNSELVSFDLIKEAIRKYKHLLFTDFPNLTLDQCLDLLKLENESGNIVQIRNHLTDDPNIYYLSNNWQEPAYLNYFEGTTQFADSWNLLIRILLFAYSLFNKSPQKIRVSGINSQENGHSFINIRLDYPSYSVINFEILEQASSEVKIKAVMPGKYIETDNRYQLYINQQKPQDLPEKNEVSYFLHNLNSGNIVNGTGLQVYHQVLSTYDELIRKLSMHASWYIKH